MTAHCIAFEHVCKLLEKHGMNIPPMTTKIMFEASVDSVAKISFETFADPVTVDAIGNASRELLWSTLECKPIETG